MTKIMFQMLNNLELAEWVSDRVPEIPQEDINGAMTMYSHLSTMYIFLEENPEVSKRFSEWLDEPSPEAYH